MATTTNFGWTTPDDTSLVKDGAAAIRTLGQSIDTSMMDLEGGTTGQVLSKASNTDMDFTWVTTDDTNAIQNAIVDAKGDLIGATAADTPARLAVGTNGQILTADSTAATGLAWATPAGGGSMTSLASGSLSTGTLSLTSISASYKDLKLVLRDVTMSGNASVTFKINNLSTFYTQGWLSFYGATVPAATSVGSASNWQANARTIKAGDSQSLTINLLDYANSTSKKQFFSQISNDDSGANEPASSLAFGHRYGTSSNDAINRLDVILSTGTFSTGTYILYGVN
jgi:hypothetical protein